MEFALKQSTFATSTFCGPVKVVLCLQNYTSKAMFHLLLQFLKKCFGILVLLLTFPLRALILSVADLGPIVFEVASMLHVNFLDRIV